MASRSNLMTGMASLWQRIDRWLLRRAWAPTTEGLVWFLLSTIILVQGLMRGFNLVSFIATFLLSMWLLNMIVTLFSSRRLSELRIKRRILGSVHVGTPINVSLEVNNTGLYTAHGLRMIDEGANHNYTVGLSYLEPRRHTEIKKQITPQKRGEYLWHPLLISSAYPFGLYRRTIAAQSDDRPAIVLPMLGQLDIQQFQRWLRQSRRASSLLTRVRSKRSTAPADFYGIREYRSGDSARWIHWRTTARVGRPMVREFEEPPQTHITVIVDTSLPDTIDALRKTWWSAHTLVQQTEQFNRNTTSPIDSRKLADLRAKEAACSQPFLSVEQAISLATTLCHVWTRRLGSTITLGILDGFDKQPAVFESGPNLRQLIPMLERLAQVNAVHDPSPDRLIHQLSRISIPDGSILLVTVRPSGLEKRLSRILSRPVQLLDLSRPQTLQRFFKSEVTVSLQDYR